MLLLTLIPSSLAQSEVGYVLTVRGEWLLDGGQPLKRWQQLRGGSTVKAKDMGERNSSITIALYDGATIRRVCANNGECAKRPKTRRRAKR